LGSKPTFDKEPAGMRANATFEITSFKDTPWTQIPDGHTLARAAILKTFRGDLEGTSELEMLMSRGPDQSAAYVALERIEARLANRSGTFVLMHAATADSSGQHGDWTVVPGSATGELRGLRGRAEYRHDATGASFTLDYELE
jgi:hypothetical protein